MKSKNNNLINEILLVNNLADRFKGLCKEPGWEKDSTDPNEKIEEAAWDGLLEEWFPDIIRKSISGTKLFLWKAHVTNSFLCVELSEVPHYGDRHYSLDPYLFIPVKNIN